ncbi:MAG: M36 family metallopeptidase, partial [Isosphaeraceae bacterium]
ISGTFNNGLGIRRFPYSYDMTVNPLTLGKFDPNYDPPGNPVSTDGTEAHNAGEIWCSVLWDMTWNLIDKYGFDPDLYNGKGGNNVALRLVDTALKLQPSNPTFLEARDAILLADRNLTGGANYFDIWKAFARRGFGVNATAGSSDTYSGIQEDFTLPPSMQVVNSPLQFSATEGVALVNVQVAQLIDQNGLKDATNYQVSVNWGDGTQPTPATLVLDGGNGQAYRVISSHLYSHAGTYPLSITAVSIATTENEVGTRSLTVLDQPLSFGPTVTIVGSETTPFAGKLASFTDANPSANANPSAYLAKYPYTVSITWGDDGTQTSGIVVPNAVGGFDVMADPVSPHLFFRGGVFQITVGVTDVTKSVTIKTTATIARAPLSAAVATIPPTASESITEGGTFKGVVGTIRGPLRSQRAGDFNVTIDWGDGSTPTTNATVTTAYDPVAGQNYFVVSGAHQYRVASTAVMAPLGYYPVSFVVVDYDNTSAMPSAPAPVVVNMAPIVLTVKPPIVNVGGVPQPLSLNDGQTFTATIATFIDSDRNTAPAEYVARIEWGDGTSSTGTVKRGKLGVGSFDIEGTHAYAYWNYGKRDYKVTVYRTDEYSRYQAILQKTPATPIADPVRAKGVASITVNDAPISALGVQGSGVEGIPAYRQVATFTVDSANVTAGQYSAQINWGDGSITAGEVGVGASTGSFVVFGSHSYPFGKYTAQVVITSRNGATATAGSVFTITDAPSTVTAAPVSAIEGIATSPMTIATFANTDSFANAARFLATINWGDGTSSAGTVTGNAASGYSVAAPVHTYANPGNYTVSVAIAQTTGRVDSAANTAFVAVRVEPVTGSLAPGIDTGVVSTAAVSRTTTPTIVGKARANSTVELYAQLAGAPAPVLLGTTTADPSGNYTVKAATALAAGSYTLTVDARNAQNQVVGQVTPILGSKPYIIDLTAPSVASTALQASRGRFVVRFADNVALNPTALLDAANYSVTSASSGAAIKVTSVKFDTTAASTDTSRTVIVTLANGRGLGSGSYLLNIRSAGTTDAAGNTLVEKKYTIPPVNTLTPVPDYFAMYKVGNPASVNPQVYVSPVSVNGAQAYLTYLRSRPRAVAARRGR